ncbi:MAG: fumarylacetoacetate hydrolase family protein [Rhodospirillales bacterium]|jgi:2-keto-4-pentenoate hydratase/2-oxohepta-3-ene-1,7-dioic acid hydratase in catechol pathway|nr:isomerase [Rhodospirillaceae bacterium]MDP6426788.1 fumarylacetoacetate hydrolase family protein [Rhodospirillales bacterium]MDP6646474.1 fumarylacetoacetate hydrolase family protein [Rhodospirillales bacterium]MDP6842168.1 fumarylacetoacetate hydrolase family protein [Rhodospirillales bacterium]|tara:strand:+ start:120 stop:1103 length:984 start_codon:yes stop_codon:yes gene_type:complete
MKLATFVADGKAPALGWVDRPGRTVIALQAAHKSLFGAENTFLRDMLSLIDAQQAGIDLIGGLVERLGSSEEFSHPLDAVQLLSPVPVPAQIRDFSVSLRHIRDAPRGSKRLKARLAGQPEPAPDPSAPEFPEIYLHQPIYYQGNRFNVVGHDADILWPGYSEYLDFELEIGMFVGRTGKNIRRSEAHRFIFGYTLFNDFSARDRQSKEMEGRLGPAKGKSFDTGNAIGPWLVTPDEIPDIISLNATVRVNGEVWAENTTADMLYSFEDMIAFVSEDETIHAGEFFGSGTVGGCCGLEMDRWIADGDVIELEIEEIGVLRNRVVRPK